MLRNFKIALAISVAVLGSLFASADAKAGWGHHHHGHHHGWGHHGGWGHGWGHHHHHGHYGGLWGAAAYGLPYYGGSWGGWGGRYTSLSIGIGWPSYWSGYTLDYPRRYPYIYPGSLSSYDDYYPSMLSYPTASYYSGPYYSSRYYAPYSSGYYASSSGYYAPSACCDPCAGLPIDSSVPATSAPLDSAPPTALPPPSDPTPASAEAAPSVQTLPNWIPSSNLTRSGVQQGRGVAGSELLTATGRDSAQSVRVAKPVTVEIATDLVPLSKALLQAADAIFAAGDYQQAAAAYARLTVRYGNHDELAVRRFISLIALGDCEQAAVMFEAASLAEQALLASSLPAGRLSELYGTAAQDREKHIDYLAAYALNHPEDGLALAMVGTWLELDGQSERAQLFMKRAAALAPSDRLPVSSAHLVATEISQ